MSSVLVHPHRHQVLSRPSQKARLSGAQLREISAQWRLRAGEDPEKAKLIADVLERLAAQRDQASRAPSLFERLRAGLAGWLRH